MNIPSIYLSDIIINGLFCSSPCAALTENETHTDKLGTNSDCTPILTVNETYSAESETDSDCIVMLTENEKLTNKCVTDSDCTILLSLMKWRRWDAALDRLSYFPWEARIWMFEAVGENDKVEKYLPLHLVCSETTRQYQLVERLIAIYPDAVRTKDRAGRLPLHLFCLGVTENPANTFFQENVGVVRDIIILLLSTFPEGIYVEEYKTQATPMKIITNSVNRSGRTAVTDTIVASLTGCHLSMEKQKIQTTRRNTIVEEGVNHVNSLN